MKAKLVQVNTRVIKVNGWVGSEEEKERGAESLKRRGKPLESQ